MVTSGHIACMRARLVHMVMKPTHLWGSIAASEQGSACECSAFVGGIVALGCHHDVW
jgi:hypothetical protein